MKVSITQLALYAGQNIRNERMRLKLSQEQLAEKAKITSQYLSLIENGRRCGISTYLRIANELGLHLSELFDITKEGSYPSSDERYISGLFCDSSLFERRVMLAVLVAIKNTLRSDE